MCNTILVIVKDYILIYWNFQAVKILARPIWLVKILYRWIYTISLTSQRNKFIINLFGSEIKVLKVLIGHQLTSGQRDKPGRSIDGKIYNVIYNI